MKVRRTLDIGDGQRLYEVRVPDTGEIVAGTLDAIILWACRALSSGEAPSVTIEPVLPRELGG